MMKSKQGGIVAETALSVKGQVVIPKQVRELLGLQPGDGLVVCVEGDTILGWKPLTSLAEGLRRTVEYFSAAGGGSG